MPDSRRKGAQGEREAAAAWTAATGLAAHRTAQRTGQHGDADVETAGVHLECKRYARIRALAFLRQAEAEAVAGRVPVALMREDGDTEWALLVRLADVQRLFDAIAAARAAGETR